MFKKLALKFAMSYLIKLISGGKFKKDLIDKVNAKLDIPKLNEKQEENLLSAVYDAVVAALTN